MLRTVFKWSDTYACALNFGIDEDSSYFKRFCFLQAANTQSWPAIQSLWEWAACGREGGTKSLLPLSSLFIPSCSISVVVSYFCFFAFYYGKYQMCTKTDNSIMNPHVFITLLQQFITAFYYTL